MNEHELHHDHEHEHHHHEEGCCCCHEHAHEQEHHSASSHKDMFIYEIKNLHCPHCAAKIQEKLSALPEIEYANLIFASGELEIKSKSEENLFALIEKTCQSVEAAVTLTLKEKDSSSKGEVPDHINSKNKKDILSLSIGALFFLLGILFTARFETISIIFYLIAYLVLGLEIIFFALKNIKKGNFFDENFLMSVATIAAICIQEYPEAVGVMLFYRLGEWFEQRAVIKSRTQIMEALDLRPETVFLLHGEHTHEIPAKEANPGNILLIRPGDRIPLDGKIVHGESRIDTSAITGESVPRKIVEGDTVLSGCMNISGVLHLCVQKRLEDSMVSRILESVEHAANGKPKIDRFITRFSRVYTPFVVILAFLTAIIPSLIWGDWHKWIYTAITFLVISCPCALVLSVPLAFFSGIGAGSKRGILFKSGLSLEALKNIKTVVLDKTGTITKGNFILQDCIVLSDSVNEDTLLTLAATCEQSSTHPIAVSILEAAKEKNITPNAPERIDEIAGHGIKVTLNNHELLCGNPLLMEEHGIKIPPVSKDSFGKTEVYLAMDQVLLGILRISDTLKSDAKIAISNIKSQGIHTVLLTGDSKESAESMARETGIDSYYSNLLPEDKLTYLQKIRSQKGAVMFVGDGINDAPVLAGADVSAAMGNGADAAIEAADIVFMTSSVTAISESLKISSKTSRIAIENVIFALLTKGIVMILGLLGFASMWLAVFADTGVAMICVLNSIRALYIKYK